MRNVNDTFIDGLETLEAVNPTISAAKISLISLKNAGIPEAESFYSRFPFSSLQLKDTDELTKRFFDIYTICQEIKYKSLNELIKKLKITNIIDLGCGFSPRGFYFSKNPEYHYIGVDLPAVIKNMHIIGNDINYHSADITNLASLKNVLHHVKGKVIILTDYVLPFLTKSELKTAVENIFQILNEHNGVWISNDIHTFNHFKIILQTVIGKKLYDKVLPLVDDFIKQQEGISLSISEVDYDKIISGIINEKGFSIREIPIYSDSLEINSIKKVPPDLEIKVKEKFRIFSNSCVYNSSEFITEEKDEKITSENFFFSVLRRSESYEILLNGRLDTISAPTLYSFYEASLRTRTEISIILNCKNLEYVSSAGLRVFLSMYKSSCGKTKIINANSEVIEILKTTGFSQFLIDNETL